MIPSFFDICELKSRRGAPEPLPDLCSCTPVLADLRPDSWEKHKMGASTQDTQSFPMRKKSTVLKLEFSQDERQPPMSLSALQAQELPFDDSVVSVYVPHSQSEGLKDFWKAEPGSVMTITSRMFYGVAPSRKPCFLAASKSSLSFSSIPRQGLCQLIQKGYTKGCTPMLRNYTPRMTPSWVSDPGPHVQRRSASRQM